MALFKILKELKQKLSEAENQIPVNGLGKWARSIRIESIKHKIERIQSEIEKRKGGWGKMSRKT